MKNFIFPVGFSIIFFIIFIIFIIFFYNIYNIYNIFYNIYNIYNIFYNIYNIYNISDIYKIYDIRYYATTMKLSLDLAGELYRDPDCHHDHHRSGDGRRTHPPLPRLNTHIQEVSKV